MGRARKVASLYARIGRTCWAWRRALVVVAAIVFVPIGFLDAITLSAEVGSFDLGNGLEIAALAGAFAVLTLTGLLGEVFYSGAVAVALTHPEQGEAPPLHEIARRLNYRRLIGVDLIYGFLVTVGLVALVAPGVAVYVWLGLAGPVVEVEGRSVRGAFARSLHLVRGHFWTVLLVLVPVEIVGDGLSSLLAIGVHGLLGSSLIATWIAESLGNVLLTPIYAVAAVLLTLDLIAEKDGKAPRLNVAPNPALA